MARKVFAKVLPRSRRRRVVVSWIRQRGQRTAKLQEELVAEEVDLVLGLCKLSKLICPLVAYEQTNLSTQAPFFRPE